MLEIERTCLASRAARVSGLRRGELREPGGHYAVTRVTEKLAMCAENGEKYVASVAH